MGLEIKNVSKKFITKNKETFTLDNINLTIKKGEFVCLLGPSGCGKSTLLNIMAGLLKPSSGTVSLNEEVVKEVGPDKAMMFQESALFPWLNVIDNVEFGMKMAGIPRDARHDKAIKYLKMVHLSKFQKSFVHELSGGMKQRVSLARALTLDSELLLMDEPFSALDSQTKSILQLELQKIWWETKKTIVFVTHNVEEAVLLGDRVVVMSANPGKIKREFKIQLARPREAQSTDLAYVAREVMQDLKEEVDKVARSEYDNDWSIEKSNILYDSNNDLGGGL